MSNYYYTLINGVLCYRKRSNGIWRDVKTDQPVTLPKKEDN